MALARWSAVLTECVCALVAWRPDVAECTHGLLAYLVASSGHPWDGSVVPWARGAGEEGTHKHYWDPF